MSDKFYGVALGGKLAKDVTKATSTTSAVFEFRTTDGTTTNRQEILNALEAIKQKIISDDFPAG